LVFILRFLAMANPNKFGFAHLADRKRWFSSFVFPPRHSSHKRGSALGLMKTFNSIKPMRSSLPSRNPPTRFGGNESGNSEQTGIADALHFGIIAPLSISFRKPQCPFCQRIAISSNKFTE